MTPEQLLEKLTNEGGAIVLSDQCSEIEISDAQCTGRFAVNKDGIGYVWRYPEWLAKHKGCTGKLGDAVGALRPFAKFACDDSCGCNNCHARYIVNLFDAEGGNVSYGPTVQMLKQRAQATTEGHG